MSFRQFGANYKRLAKQGLGDRFKLPKIKANLKINREQAREFIMGEDD